MRKSDKELFGQLTLKEHYNPNSYAIQTLFSYGWDFIGFDDKDGLREVFKTEKKANKEIKEILELTGDSPDEWRVVPYNPYKDDSFARF